MAQLGSYGKSFWGGYTPEQMDMDVAKRNFASNTMLLPPVSKDALDTGLAVTLSKSMLPATPATVDPETAKQTATFRPKAKGLTTAAVTPTETTPAINNKFPSLQGSIQQQGDVTEIRGIPGHSYVAPYSSGAHGGAFSPEADTYRRGLADALQSALMNMNPTMNFGFSTANAPMKSPGWGGKVLPGLLEASGKDFATQAAQLASAGTTDITGQHYRDLATEAAGKQAIAEQKLPSDIELHKAQSEQAKASAIHFLAAAKAAGQKGGTAADNIETKAQNAEKLLRTKAQLTEEGKIKEYLMANGMPFDPVSVQNFKNGMELTVPTEGKKHLFRANEPAGLGGWVPKNSIRIGTDEKGRPIYASKPKK
jgi:hypothetical protein